MKKRLPLIVALLLFIVIPLFTQEPNPASDFVVELNSTGDGVIIIRYVGTRTDVVIPAEIEGFPVLHIGNMAFTPSGTSIIVRNPARVSITSIVFPNTRITIGEYAFAGSNLTDVTLPDSITNIGRGAFSNCLQLESLIINFGNPNPDWNPNSLFRNCIKLTTVEFTRGWVVIPTEMFAGCSNLTSINFPDGIRTINNSAFENCGFTELTIPEGIEFIALNAFRNNKITNLILPSTITTIGSCAFQNNGLLELVIPESINSVNFGRNIAGRHDAFGGNRLNLRTQALLKNLGYNGNF